MNSFTDIKSFNLLFNEYYQGFIRFAQSYVRERETAQDFVSEAFALFWENRNNLSPDIKPQSYILTIVKNKCLNHLQHLQVRQRTEKMLSEHESWRLTLSINTLHFNLPKLLHSRLPLTEVQPSEHIVDAIRPKGFVFVPESRRVE